MELKSPLPSSLLLCREYLSRRNFPRDKADSFIEKADSLRGKASCPLCPLKEPFLSGILGRGDQLWKGFSVKKCPHNLLLVWPTTKWITMIELQKLSL